MPSYVSGKSLPWSTLNSEIVEDEPELSFTDRKDKRRSYQKGIEIGKGAYGKVYNAINKDTGQHFAIKEIHFHGLPMAQIEEKMNLIEREVELVMKLSHDNIITYYGIKREEKSLQIFLELSPGGSIRAMIRKFGCLNEKLVRKLTKQILQGLKYLHDRNIVHGDIKCDNVLVDTQSRVKLADFGASRQINKGNEFNTTQLVGTPNFMAPEVIMQSGFGLASDIWSLGCSVIEMFTGYPPFSECNNVASVIYQIVSLKDIPPLPDDISRDARDFLIACFVRNPKERPTAQELLHHHWIKDFEVTFNYSSPIPTHEYNFDEFDQQE